MHPRDLLIRAGVKVMVLDTVATTHHPRFVRVKRALASVFVLVAMATSQAGVLCQGWQSSSEARMACCTEGVDCGMHEAAASTESAGPRAQAAADQCCAASESNDSQAPRSLVTLQGPAIAVRLPLELALADVSAAHAWHALTAFSPPRHVSTHILLSVFLV